MGVSWVAVWVAAWAVWIRMGARARVRSRCLILSLYEGSGSNLSGFCGDLLRGLAQRQLRPTRRPLCGAGWELRRTGVILGRFDPRRLGNLRYMILRGVGFAPKAGEDDDVGEDDEGNDHGGEEAEGEAGHDAEGFGKGDDHSGGGFDDVKNVEEAGDGPGEDGEADFGVIVRRHLGTGAEPLWTRGKIKLMLDFAAFRHGLFLRRTRRSSSLRGTCGSSSLREGAHFEI